MEAIIRRLFLIGLRLQGVQFRIAQTIVDEYPPMGLEKHMKNVFAHCGIDYAMKSMRLIFESRNFLQK